LLLAVRSDAPSRQLAIPADINPPELFVPELGQSNDILNGAWFVAFSTVDKGLGLDHFEVMEIVDPLLSIFGSWKRAESPYVLQDQNLRSYILVKAIDRAGLSRTVTLRPKHSLPWREIGFGIIIILVIIFLIRAKKIWRKNY
jgi:hypothetical protein